MPGPGRAAINLMKTLAGFGGRGYRGGLLTTGLMGAGMIGAGKALNAIADTPWGQEQAPVSRAMMGLGSAGLQFGGYLAIARGAVGSAQAAYDRGFTFTKNKFVSRLPAVPTASMRGSTGGSYGMLGLGPEGGNPALAALHRRSRAIDVRMTRGFNGAKRMLGGALHSGSPINRMVFGNRDRTSPLGRGVWAASKGIAKVPFQIATGMVDVAAQGIPNAARFFFGGGGGRSVGSLMQPRSLFGNMPFLKEGRAAMGAGMFGWTGAAALGTHYINQRGDQASGWKGGARDFNPADYGGGFYAMRRDSASNYGPALTLALHRNNSRVMP